MRQAAAQPDVVASITVSQPVEATPARRASPRSRSTADRPPEQAHDEQREDNSPFPALAITRTDADVVARGSSSAAAEMAAVAEAPEVSRMPRADAIQWSLPEASRHLWDHSSGASRSALLGRGPNDSVNHAVPTAPPKALSWAAAKASDGASASTLPWRSSRPVARARDGAAVPAGVAGPVVTGRRPEKRGAPPKPMPHADATVSPSDTVPEAVQTAASAHGAAVEDVPFKANR
jgi:hypothetical protein